MRRQVFAFTVMFCLLAVHCTVNKPTEYNIPPDVGEANRKALVERFEKGKILYINNCSACHGIYTKGKDSVTNFTKQQIDNYTVMALANPKNHAVLKKISADQFDYITTFLRLRKPGKKA